MDDTEKQKVIDAAVAAEERLHAIAKTRKPTEAERAEALAAYAAAAKVTKKAAR